MSKKKVYIKVNKEIEPGDLVRCVYYNGHDAGEVHKVYQVFEDYFSLYDCPAGHNKSLWEPVHKLQIGDQVICRRPGIEKKPWTVKDIDSQGNCPVRLIQDYPMQFLRTNACELELYQPEKHKPRPAPDLILRLIGPHEFSISLDPVDKDKFLIDLRSISHRQDTRRQDMRIAVAEMIVELLDRNDGSFDVSLFSHQSGRRVSVVDSNFCHSTAKLSPNDTWDTLTGVYVALCKATGRKLPDWIYGERP